MGNLVCLLAILAATAIAQVRPSLMEDAGKENLPSQHLGIDDLVAVSVYDAPELTRTARVEPGGLIHLPLLKNGITAAGSLPGNWRHASPRRWSASRSWWTRW